MTDSVPDSIKALWAMHDEPRFGAMSLDQIKHRAALLDASDVRMRFVGPAIASVFTVFFAFTLMVHQTAVERLGDAAGLAAGLIMGFRIHRLNRNHLVPGALGMEGVRAYRAALVRLRIANDISWQTILLVQAGFALQIAATATGGGRSALVVALSVPILGVVLASALRYRALGVRLRRQIRELDQAGPSIA